MSTKTHTQYWQSDMGQSLEELVKDLTIMKGRRIVSIVPLEYRANLLAGNGVERLTWALVVSETEHSLKGLTGPG